MQPIDLIEFVLELLQYAFVAYTGLIIVNEMAEMIKGVVGRLRGTIRGALKKKTSE